MRMIVVYGRARRRSWALRESAATDDCLRCVMVLKTNLTRMFAYLSCAFLWLRSLRHPPAPHTNMYRPTSEERGRSKMCAWWPIVLLGQANSYFVVIGSCRGAHSGRICSRIQARRRERFGYSRFGRMPPRAPHPGYIKGPSCLLSWR